MPTNPRTGLHVQGVKAVIKALHDEGKFASEIGRKRVVVGYSEYYAIYVHENLSAYHPVGQAKFLEQPSRTMARQLSDMIRQSMRKGGGTGAALLKAGEMLKKASQELCPVDTGALRRSAFVRLQTVGGVW